MTLLSKNSSRAFTIVAVSLFLATFIVPALAQEPIQTYRYNMSFDHDGFTAVEIIYDGGFVSSGSSWVAVPKNFTDTSVTSLHGTITSMTRVAYRSGDGAGVHPFYDNLTFSYTSDNEPFSMRLRFNMTYGAMIVEPDGFFYSPQIGVPSSAKVQAKLTFPDGVESLDDAQPTPVQVQTLGSRISLLFTPSSESRIAVTFKVSWAKETGHLREGTVDAEVPSRYSSLGAEMVELYRKAIPLMNDLFNGTVDQISLKFFTPLSLPDLGIGGYTPIDPSSFQTGAIYLNLFYFRTLPGTMETIAIHELTHQYEAHAGIAPDLLWVHEGLANYVAVQMGKPLSYDVASTDAELEAVASQLGGNYNIVQDWRPGGTVASLYQYYAASYDIFKTLGNRYGGLSLYSRFLRELHGLKDGLRSTNVAVYELSVAAGTDLFSQFTTWGFELVDLSGISSRINKLRAEAGWYGPALPFREQALNQLDMAQSSMYSSPEVALGHVTIAAFYIETVPMIIGGALLLLALAAALAVVISRRSGSKQIQSSDYATS